jgi:hypothetical protein
LPTKALVVFATAPRIDPIWSMAYQTDDRPAWLSPSTK